MCFDSLRIVSKPRPARYAAALNQLTRNLACEWGRDHIRVNAVAPYYIATPRLEPLLADEEYTRKVVERCPLGRVGEAQDVAGALRFLHCAMAQV